MAVNDREMAESLTTTPGWPTMVSVPEEGVSVPFAGGDWMR
ncbi:hypothetical protein ATPR_2078 [Acetobacter tropicalis NBRC 101654]|uniref:Uncharacterized protein n=1 Tax=Acetobacter tropicalis NBRC 101654 TaxID=749388 RepID=F7VFC9_9PROT|nr:hypothetical protein ATPR_2078 [Acetobacter tropicalis NBRC 101654]